MEKDAASPKPSSSLKRKRIKKTNEPTRRKKRKRQSLVEMLAQCIDQNTLKSVILAHQKQKCDLSSSIDSDSEDDSDDVVSKIFRTVCTIDLCDDDDETIHEDVLQYMDENQELEEGCDNDGNSMCPSDADESQDAGEIENTQPYKSSDDKSQEGKLNPEPSEIAVEVSEQECMPNPPVDEDLSRENIASTPAITSKESDDIAHTENNLQDLDMAKADLEPTAIPIESSNIPGTEAESNSPILFEDTESQTESCDPAVEERVSVHLPPTPPSTEDISKLDNNQDACPTKKPERTMLKLRPFEEISSCSKPQVAEHAVSTNVGKKLSFDEALTKGDSTLLRAKRTPKRIRKVRKGKTSVSDAKNEHSIDDNQNESRQAADPLVTSSMEPIRLLNAACPVVESPKRIEQMPKEKVKFSSVSVSDDSTVGSIKIKIKIEKDFVETNPASDIAVPILNNHPKVNGIQYPSRSRKRKRGELLQEQEEDAATTAPTAPIPNESIRTRPIFDNFDTPEILTTKRARKSKSYVDCEIPSIDAVKPKTRSTNQRASNRKVNAKSVEKDDNPELESRADKRFDRVEDVADVPISEPEKPSAVIEVRETNTEPKLDSPSVKKGRGPKQVELAPLNVAEQYICGNCKEEVLAKNWAKHTKVHYGLSWRVDIDPPLVSLAKTRH